MTILSESNGQKPIAEDKIVKGARQIAEVQGDKPKIQVNMERAKAHGISLARRPTGGGILFHLTDLAFSVLLPTYPESPLESYALINKRVAALLKDLFHLEGLTILQDESDQAFRFCMAKPTVYDVLWKGGKLVGAAQRRTKRGLLHQGSISICPPPWKIVEDLLAPDVVRAMKETSRFLTDDVSKLADYRKKIEAELRNLF